MIVSFRPPCICLLIVFSYHDLAFVREIINFEASLHEKMNAANTSTLVKSFLARSFWWGGGCCHWSLMKVVSRKKL